MAVDDATVRRVARLARIAVADKDVPALGQELNAIIAFVEELDALDVGGVEPMTGVTPMTLRMRKDEVTTGDMPDVVLGNAPEREGDFFVVPKVVE
jgi:aspartyl-tRNA(Asn)/glutamyl-tRNA(Gln) amidotransferase subunit C